MTSEDPTPPDKSMSLQEIYEALVESESSMRQLLARAGSVLHLIITEIDPDLLREIGVDDRELNRVFNTNLEETVWGIATVQRLKGIAGDMLEAKNSNGLNGHQD